MAKPLPQQKQKKISKTRLASLCLAAVVEIRERDDVIWPLETEARSGHTWPYFAWDSGARLRLSSVTELWLNRSLTHTSDRVILGKEMEEEEGGGSVKVVCGCGSMCTAK